VLVFFTDCKELIGGHRFQRRKNSGYLVPERKPPELQFSCHCEGGTTEAIRRSRCEPGVCGRSNPRQ